MPTHHDETLLQRYQRERRDYEGISMSEHTQDQAVGAGRNPYYAGQFDAEEPADTASRLRLVAERDRLSAINAELLEALKGLMQLEEEDHQRGHSDDDVCMEVRAARAAIAKVQGEQP